MKDEPRNTGLLNLVNRRYTIVPAPAPKSAAAGSHLSPVPLTIMGTSKVAAMIAIICWNANTKFLPKDGLSLMP